MDPHISLLFGHRAPRLEVSSLKQSVEAQSKNLSQMDKTCKELRYRVDSLVDKVNRLGNK